MAGIARENGSRIMSDWKRRINDPVGLRSELTRLGLRHEWSPPRCAAFAVVGRALQSNGKYPENVAILTEVRRLPDSRMVEERWFQ